MGHVHMPPLPRTRKWKQVVELVAGGADAATLAAATNAAADRGLRDAAADHGVVEAYWLLVRLPLAARAPDFAAALRDCGMAVAAPPDLLDVAVAFSAAVDARMENNRGRTDLGEMAQTAAAEAVNAVVGPRADSLFGAGPDEVREAFAALATPARFGFLARQFFARFGFKCLDYFLAKAVPDQLGEGKRFRTLGDQARFTDALRAHCDETALIAERFAGEWFSLHRFQTAGDISREETQRFLAHAVTKLTDEFRRREGGDAR